ncbi:uncharacterized protein [Miscanthus floridulus]|uniref:uncharacterized protein n=1 Tax=Miscanthus floridulus TaxID=154761 RepID=UPI00345745B1
MATKPKGSMSILLLAVAVATAACTTAFAQTSRLGKLVVTGVVPCNTGTLIDATTSPAFPGACDNFQINDATSARYRSAHATDVYNTTVNADANVELRCGGNVVAGGTTSRNGSFAIEADLTSALEALVGSCQLLVDTPLAKCNASLPAAGALASYLQGSLAGMLSGVFRLAPAGFSFRMN